MNQIFINFLEDQSWKEKYILLIQKEKLIKRENLFTHSKNDDD
jgi:hypothetical protein